MNQVHYNYPMVSSRFLLQDTDLSESLVESHKEMVMSENQNYIIPHKKVSRKTMNIS